jgi:hypothetical protein
MALFGMGIRDQAKKFMPASFSFPIDRAILAAAQAGANLALTFVPTGPLINGKPSSPKLASKVKIGGFSIAVETRRKR